MLYAIRLTCSYALLTMATDSGLVKSFMDYINELFETVIVYEHADGKNENIHCHLLVHDENGITADAIKKNASFKALKIGNRQHSFKTKFKDKRTGVTFDMNIENVDKYITYMTKGIYEPKWFQGKWDESDLDELKNKWVSNPKSKTKMQVEAFDKYLNNEHPDLNQLRDPHEWLKRKVLNYIMNKYDGFNGAAAAEFKMLLVTFAWKRGYMASEKSKQYI